VALGVLIAFFVTAVIKIILRFLIEAEIISVLSEEEKTFASAAAYSKSPWYYKLWHATKLVLIKAANA